MIFVFYIALYCKNIMSFFVFINPYFSQKIDVKNPCLKKVYTTLRCL